MRMKPAMTLDDAKKMMAAAEAEAVRNNWEVVIAILNDGGRIVAVHRMDGARPGNDDIAIAKATTSAMTCRPSAGSRARTRPMRRFRSSRRRAGCRSSWTATSLAQSACPA